MATKPVSAKAKAAKAPAKKTPSRVGSAVGARSRARSGATHESKIEAKAKQQKAARGLGSSEPVRARGKPGNSKRAPAQLAAAALAATPGTAQPPRRGRPKNSPDVWTPEHLEEVANLLWNYIEATEYPTEAEFCYKYGIAFQRLCEFPILREIKEFLFAKRQANTVRRGLKLGQGDGPLGGFLKTLAANAGPFSIVDKGESVIRDGGAGSSIFENLSDEDLEQVIANELAERSRG